MLKLKTVKPIGQQILVSEDLYGYDDKDASGIIVHKKGDIKEYQTVIAVGDDAKWVKPGDKVMINFYNYAVFKYDKNSVRAGDDNPIVGLRLNELIIEKDGKEPVTCFIIDCRDIKYIIEDSEEVSYNDNDELVKIKQPKVNLILPNKKLKI